MNPLINKITSFQILLIICRMISEILLDLMVFWTGHTRWLWRIHLLIYTDFVFSLCCYILVYCMLMNIILGLLALTSSIVFHWQIYALNIHIWCPFLGHVQAVKEFHLLHKYIEVLVAHYSFFLFLLFHLFIFALTFIFYLKGWRLCQEYANYRPDRLGGNIQIHYQAFQYCFGIIFHWQTSF